MDFSIICRFCMAKDGPMMEIFKDTAMIAKANALLPNLKLLDDGLPNQICKHCAHQLKAAYKFKTKCEHTDIILRSHLQKTQSANTSSIISQNATVPVEIKIESDDDDDDDGGGGGNIAEPLVALSLTVNLEDQDPLDLGPQEIRSLYDTNSCSTQSSNLLSRHSKPALTQNSHHSGMVCANLRNSNSNVPNSQEQKSLTVPCSNVVHSKSDSTQINHSAEENSSISEHFLNESYEELQHKQISNVTQYKCPICSIPYISKYRMELHLAEHYGETPYTSYTCPICKKRFGREGGLKAHLKLHTGVKPHVCEVCNKAFSLKGNLKVHQRLHTGEKPFQCTTCMKAFTQKVSLVKHSSVHRANTVCDNTTSV